jgi:hypothetical protein
VYDYIFPQLEMMFDENKINVAINFDERTSLNSNSLYKCCNVDDFNYIDFTKVKYETDNVTKYTIEDDLLLYIAISRCDFIMGDFSIINYEASIRKTMMIHNLANKLVSSDMIIPANVVFHESTLFPSSQILMKYISF